MIDRARLAWLTLPWVALVCASCSTSPSGTGSSPETGLASVRSDADGGSASVTGCVINETRPCDCGGQPGRSACNAGVWSDCACSLGEALTGTPGGGGVGGSEAGSSPASNDAPVSFDWVPQDKPACVPGLYEGEFSCDFYMNAACDGPLDPTTGTGFQTTITGPIRIELVESESGEFLEIREGELSGVAMGGIAFGNALMGRLDCTTQRFEAEAVDGQYGLPDPLCLDGQHCILAGTNSTYSGNLEGDYDDQALSIEGEWDLCAPGFGRCPGPWTVRLMP